MGRWVRFRGSDGNDGLPTDLTARGVKNTHLNTMKQASFKFDEKWELADWLKRKHKQQHYTMSVTSMVKANAQMCAFEVLAHIQFILKGLASSHQVLAL